MKNAKFHFRFILSPVNKSLNLQIYLADYMLFFHHKQIIPIVLMFFLVKVSHTVIKASDDNFFLLN